MLVRRLAGSAWFVGSASDTCSSSSLYDTQLAADPSGADGLFGARSWPSQSKLYVRVLISSSEYYDWVTWTSHSHALAMSISGRNRPGRRSGEPGESMIWAASPGRLSHIYNRPAALHCALIYVADASYNFHGIMSLSC